MAKRGLGKGLQALIPPVSSLEKNNTGDYNEVQYLSLIDIIPNTYQPRKNFNQEKLQELADSIKEHGVVQPIVVRAGEKKKYEIVAGERRWRACKLLDMDTIPAIIKDFSDQQITEIALIENVQREDLNPVEEAWAYKTLLEEFDLTQELLSAKVGKSRSYIANMMRLLNLPIEIQEFLSDGQLSVGHARALLAINEIDKQLDITKKIINQGLNVRETEKLVKQTINESSETEKEINKNKTEEISSPFNIIIEEKLQEVLRTKVKLKQKNNERGKIEIEYYTKDDLERILELISGEDEI
jgi:ParB family chromosome partitioning protein